MKKILLTGAVIVSMFALAGCGAQKAKTNDTADNKTKEGMQIILDDPSAQLPEDEKTKASDKASAADEVKLEENTEKAPDFTAEIAGGGSFKLSDQKDKIVLLNFWATWCGPCVGEMPAFQRLYEEYGDELSILAVNCVQSKEEVDAFIKEKGYTFPIAYDTNGEICSKYPTDGIPYTLVIGKDGTVKMTYLGADTAEVQYEEYKAAIEAVKKSK